MDINTDLPHLERRIVESSDPGSANACTKEGDVSSVDHLELRDHHGPSWAFSWRYHQRLYEDSTVGAGAMRVVGLEEVAIAVAVAAVVVGSERRGEVGM